MEINKEIKTNSTITLELNSRGKDFQAKITVGKWMDYCKNCVPNHFNINIDEYREIGKQYDDEKAKNVATRHPCYLQIDYLGIEMPKGEQSIKLCGGCSKKTVEGFLRYGDNWKLETKEKENVVNALLNEIREYE